ncbi:MAG: hypothetical protein HOP15_10470, partial [Planctomycetes bacterium]|nr:hypothetical protein [Planctomycetota bacterium]
MAGPVSAQAKEGQEPEKPVIELPKLSGLDAAQEEMIRLFHEVERTLAAIDVELFDA